MPASRSIEAGGRRAGAGLGPRAPHEQLRLSARTGAGLDALRKRLLKARRLVGRRQRGLYIARRAPCTALRQVGEHLEVAALHIASRQLRLDLLAEERLAQNALNVITGAFSSDDLLGVIFSSFCIGK